MYHYVGFLSWAAGLIVLLFVATIILGVLGYLHLEAGNPLGDVFSRLTGFHFQF
jgi:hypothetical protein